MRQGLEVGTVARKYRERKPIFNTLESKTIKTSFRKPATLFVSPDQSFAVTTGRLILQDGVHILDPQSPHHSHLAMCGIDSHLPGQGLPDASPG